MDDHEQMNELEVEFQPETPFSHQRQKQMFLTEILARKLLTLDEAYATSTKDMKQLLKSALIDEATHNFLSLCLDREYGESKQFHGCALCLLCHHFY